MSTTIHNVAIHDLIKKGGAFGVNAGNASLKITATTQRVIETLYDLYKRRASKSHGKFSTDVKNFPTQTYLHSFVMGESNFATLTLDMMSTLSIQASHKGAATGGHVFFANFNRDAREYMMVAIITDKLGAALTGTYDVTDATHLDMDGFRFAGRIDLTGWAQGEDRYIGFLKGKGDVSGYFKEFLGCDTTVQDRVDTYDLVAALKKYADDNSMVGEDRDDFLTRAKWICDKAARLREELEFETLANELTPKNPTHLLEALADPALKLNDRFVPDRRALNTLVRFRAKTPLWSLEFDRDAIRSGKVVFSPKDNTLTLMDLPADLSSELQAELAENA